VGGKWAGHYLPAGSDLRGDGLNRTLLTQWTDARRLRADGRHVEVPKNVSRFRPGRKVSRGCITGTQSDSSMLHVELPPDLSSVLWVRGSHQALARARAERNSS
jgi:hypothetical protein